jgi:hypothetical protein
MAPPGCKQDGQEEADKSRGQVFTTRRFGVFHYKNPENLKDGQLEIADFFTNVRNLG